MWNIWFNCMPINNVYFIINRFIFPSILYIKENKNNSKYIPIGLIIIGIIIMISSYIAIIWKFSSLEVY